MRRGGNYKPLLACLLLACCLLACSFQQFDAVLCVGTSLTASAPLRGGCDGGSNAKRLSKRGDKNRLFIVLYVPASRKDGSYLRKDHSLSHEAA